MSTATHHLARLATLWGETKTTEYVKALAGQQPFLGELGAISTVSRSAKLFLRSH